MNIIKSHISNSRPPSNITELRGHKEIPVHIHIPKCGGTFVRRSMADLLRLYCLSVYGAPVVKQGAIIFIGGGEVPDSPPHLIAYCFFSPPDFAIPKNPDLAEQKIYYRMTVDAFLEAVAKGNLDVFSMSVTSVMLAQKRVGELDKIKAAWEDKFGLRFFTTMRPPFERAQSLYYVQKRRNPGLSCFTGEEPSLQEFSDFLMSPFSEPNWVCKFLAYVFQEKTGSDPQIPMDQAVFEKLLQTMQEHVRISQTGLLGEGLRDTFAEVYSPYIGDFALDIESQSPASMFNRTQKKIIFKPEDVTEDCLASFKKSNSYDIALFEEVFQGV